MTESSVLDAPPDKPYCQGHPIPLIPDVVTLAPDTLSIPETLAGTLAGQAHFGNYNPASFGWGDPRSSLVPLVVNGVSFGHCARDAHGLLTAFLVELAPHIPGGLKAGSCWCWSTTDELPGGGHSFHWYGTAVDVNWNVNHMGNNIPDATGKWAIPRTIATMLARKYGMEWGGNWLGGYHDDMHFEIHVSPSVARTVTGTISEDELSAAEVKTITDHMDALNASMNSRVSTLEQLVSKDRVETEARMASGFSDLKNFVSSLLGKK